MITANNSWYIYNFRSELIEQLLADGYRVICVSGDNSYQTDLERLGVEFHMIQYTARSKSASALSRNIFSYIKVLRQVKPTICLSFNPMANLCVSVAQLFSNAKQMATVSGFGVLSKIIKGRDRATLSVKLKKYVLSQYLKIPAVVLCQNEEDEKFVRKVRKSLPTLRVKGSGVPLQKFRAKQRNYSTRRFMFAARFLLSKGIIDYIEAARNSRVNRSEFYICGLPVDEGSGGMSEKDVIEALANTNITYLGHVTNMAPLLQSTDVVVLPSQYGEGIPRSLIEASASGCLLVAYDNDGVREIVRNEQNGFLLPVPDVLGLQRAFEKIDRMTAEELQNYSLRSRGIAERDYSVTVVNKVYIDSIRDLVRY
ncbi:glycosyltransferase [Sulfitobacter sp. SBS6]|uniref:glycosyltransferase n=1 Tax=Sulfitobacter sp. SBS6 TaxID=3401755 RepID=UPI003AAF4EDC